MEVFCNTVQFRFPPGASPPSWEEIAEFAKRLHSDIMQMEAVYKLPQGRSVCIKYKSLEAMEEILRRSKESFKFHYSNGKIVDVHMSAAGKNTTYVRVFDLPPEVPDHNLALVFAEHGKVGSIVREKFPPGLGLDHLYTGVRGVYVDIEKEIPPSLEVSGWKARIFYDGLKDKCFLCSQEGHRKDSCPQRRTRKPREKKKTQKLLSYAGVVGSGATEDSADVIVIEEEIIDEMEIQSTVDEIVEQEETKQQGKEQEESERKRERQEKALARLANLVKDAVSGQQATERRAQFAAAESESTEMLRPKKTARKSSR